MDESKLKKRLLRERQKVKILEKLAEEKTREAYKEAENARLSYTNILNIFESIPDPLIVTDENLKIIKYNKVASDRFSYSDKKFTGSYLTDYLISNNLDWKNFSAERVNSSTDHELFLCANDIKIPITVSVSKLSTEKSGEDRKYVFILKDISTRIELDKQKSQEKLKLEELVSQRTRQLKLAKQKAEHANQTKSLFLANMSHEIRTPLNALSGIITIMLGDSHSASNLEKLKKIQIASDSLTSIVNDILDFTKIEAGEISIENIDFSLSKIIYDVVDLFIPMAKKNKVCLNKELPSNFPEHWKGDPTRIKQVLSNLVSNAIKFTNGGEVTLKVEKIGEMVSISVEDSGVGISEEKIKSIFLPFNQADISTTRKFGGTGLGLSICKHLAELMSGKISVSSIPEQGSKFTVTLPLKQSLQSVEDHVGANSESAFPSEKFKVLVVEDNDLNQFFISEVLTGLNIMFEIASDGLIGLEKSQAVKFDLILMDCQMPNMDGFTASKKISSDPQNPNRCTPILALTANALSSVKQKCFESGMSGFYTKPLSVKKLKYVVSTWLKNSYEHKSQMQEFNYVEPGLNQLTKKSTNQDQTYLNDSPHIDWTFIEDLNFSGKKGDDNFEPILNRFLEDYEEFRNNINNLAELDNSHITISAHKFKSSCDIIGANQASEYCRRLEELASQGNQDEIYDLALNIAKEINIVVSLLEQHTSKKKIS